MFWRRKKNGNVCLLCNDNCSNEGTQLCFYPNNEIVYYVDNEDKIPIKAWGTVEVQYHRHKQPNEKQGCSKCQVSCIQGGIQLFSDEPVLAFEVYAEPFCLIKKQPKNFESIILPKEIFLSNYVTHTKIWQYGEIVKTLSLSCPANSLCESIQWYFCRKALFNPQCASAWQSYMCYLLRRANSACIVKNNSSSRTLLPIWTFYNKKGMARHISFKTFFEKRRIQSFQFKRKKSAIYKIKSKVSYN